MGNRWRVCLHKIVEGREREEDRGTGKGEGQGKHGTGKKRKTERKRKPKPVTWLGKAPFQIQTVDVSGWGILERAKDFIGAGSFPTKFLPPLASSSEKNDWSQVGTDHVLNPSLCSLT